MTESYGNFQKAKDEISQLISCYDDINKKNPDKAPRVLKRATLIMILTAWETYVEDVVEERLNEQMTLLKGSHICSYVLKNLKEKYKRFHTPDSKNTKYLFKDFLGIDVTENWAWNNFDQERVREQLNQWIKRRGAAVHRISVDDNTSDAIKREEVDKCMCFFNELVLATEGALAMSDISCIQRQTLC